MDPNTVDVGLADIRRKIQSWLDIQGEYPEENDPSEYGFYIEKCFPIPSDRSKFFRGIFRGAKPHIGYQLLCLLAEAGKIHSVWTTNFDGLVVKAASSANLDVYEVARDTVFRLERISELHDLVHVSLHGDYRYDSLKNTAPEVQSLDGEFLQKLVDTLRDTSLIVIGYSGRDSSIMNALTEAYSLGGSGRLYWCCYGNETPSGSVKDLVLKARQNERDAFVIRTEGVDQLMSDICALWLPQSLQSKSKAIISSTVYNSSHQRLSRFTLPQGFSGDLIKSNAFPLSIPTELLQFDCPSLFDGPGVWKKLRKITRNHHIEAVPFKKKVLAYGIPEQIMSAFGNSISGDIERTPISEKDLLWENGAVHELLEQTLFRAIADSNKLDFDGKNIISLTTSKRSERVLNNTYRVFDAAELRIRYYDSQLYLVVIPTVTAKDINNHQPPVSVLQELRRKILSKQYNRSFNDALLEWRKKIILQRTYHFPLGSSDPFVFRVEPKPTFSLVGETRSDSVQKQTQSSSLDSITLLPAFRFDEPKLVFASPDGNRISKDTNPIRGILQNRPLDFALSSMSRDIKIGVICPHRDAIMFHEFLCSLNSRHAASEKDAYISNFPGFAQAFGLPTTVPSPLGALWATPADPNSNAGVVEGAKVIRESLMACIDSLCSSSRPNVITILVPDRWKSWEAYSLDGEEYDLHNFIKAYCAQKGITTQFIREKTVHQQNKCRLYWWLSLSFYVKSMKTPWAIDQHASDTAYVGIGYSKDNIVQNRRNHIILGCSHIYRADGIGLRYRLKKIDNPIIIGKNPFMSQEDARRLGESTRRLLLESGQVCKRVVIHKRTPFHSEERNGLLEGLGDVDVVDMLEITEEPALRFVASQHKDGNLSGAPFPVKRGTTVLLSDRKAALYTHGSTEALSPKLNYYLGGNRIPVPLVLTRHHGESSLAELATQILGLTKMNWNHFDMYSKLPATIQSSNAIARIGSLMERFTTESYDYRLFI